MPCVVTFYVAIGVMPRVTFELLFRYFNIFGVSGLVGPFAPHINSSAMNNGTLCHATGRGGFGSQIAADPLDLFGALLIATYNGTLHSVDK